MTARFAETQEHHFRYRRKSLIFDFFRPFPGFFNLFQSAFLDRGDFDAGDEGMFGIDLSVAGVEGADVGERAMANHVDQGAQPPAGQRHVMGGKKQVQAVFRGFGLVLALRDTFVPVSVLTIDTIGGAG